MRRCTMQTCECGRHDAVLVVELVGVGDVAGTEVVVVVGEEDWKSVARYPEMGLS